MKTVLKELNEATDILDANKAFDLAFIMDEREEKIRQLKGKLWNKCKEPMRRELCHTFSWNTYAMKVYGTYVKDMKLILGDKPAQPGFYQMWRNYHKRGFNRENRVKLMKEDL